MNRKTIEKIFATTMLGITLSIPAIMIPSCIRIDRERRDAYSTSTQLYEISKKKGENILLDELNLLSQNDPNQRFVIKGDEGGIYFESRSGPEGCTLYGIPNYQTYRIGKITSEEAKEYIQKNK